MLVGVAQIVGSSQLRPILFVFFNDTATTEIYTLSLHDALPIYLHYFCAKDSGSAEQLKENEPRSEEHTSELQSLRHLVCRLLLEKKKDTEEPSRARRHSVGRTVLSPISDTRRGRGRGWRAECRGRAPSLHWPYRVFFFIKARPPPTPPPPPPPPLSRT